MADETVGCVREYELMRIYRVFTDEKICGIMTTRQNYQYKLSRNTKCIRDYVDCIIYEKKVHSLVVAVESYRKVVIPDIKEAMCYRVVQLYKEALYCFPEEGRILEAFIKFCKINFPREVPNGYETLFQKQGNKPVVWIDAAMWYHKQGNNMLKIMEIFARSVQLHSECGMLYTTFFGIVLEEIADQPKELQSGCVQHALYIFNAGKKEICHVDFMINLISQCDGERYQDFIRPTQKIIIEETMNIYARAENFWHFLAQRELKGLNMTEFFNSFQEPDSTSDKEKKEKLSEQALLKRNIEMCVKLYTTAVKVLKTDTMWTMFLNVMIDLNTDLSTESALKQQKLAQAFKLAHDNNALTEDTYFDYINRLIEIEADPEFIHNVMVRATAKFNTIKLWVQRLQYYIDDDDEVKAYYSFRRATVTLGIEAYPLWRLLMHYYQTHTNHKSDRVERLFNEASRVDGPQFGIFRVEYLEWLFANRPLDYVRKIYEDIARLPPPCLEFHQTMAKFEAQTYNAQLCKQRNCHKNAVQDFGNTRPDVWIDFIKFEQKHGEPDEVSALYERAKLVLDPIYVKDFIVEYSALQK